MSPKRWKEVDDLLQSVLQKPFADRENFLRQACGHDELLEREVRSLLEAQQEAASFLESPAIKIAAQALAARQDGDADFRALPSRIGGYQIVRLVGEGGMGVVYEAVQHNPHRTVALKVIKPGLAVSSLRRFEHESEALGRLQHAGIAQIYEAGTADTGFGPQPYFAMEFIRGEVLGQYAKVHRLGLRTRLELMVKICEPVDHAHQRGVIHRDLKPGNILVDETGQPKILDFGVARLTNSETQGTRQTDLGQIVGTLEYMSPEQVLADPAEIDIRSDVYALGVILYELLAGRRPYKLSRQLHEAMQTIREEDPQPLSSVSRDYRGDIETIVAKALEKDKARRYGSAAALAADIQRYLTDEPISARPPSANYQLHKFARRHKALVSSATVVFVVLLAGVVASTREAVRANRAQQEALQGRDRAAAAEQAATRQRDAALRAQQVASVAEAHALQERNRAVAEKQRADNEAATAKAVNDFMQNDLLAQASATTQAGIKTKPDADLKVRTALDRAAARIAGKFDREPLVEASLRQTIGRTYLELGLYGKAQPEIQRAIDLRRRALGDENPSTLESVNAQANVLHAQGHYAQAEALYTRILEARQRILGEHHRDTISSMNGLVSVYRDQTKYAQAAALVAKAMESQRRTLGEEHPETLRTMLEMARVDSDLGKYPQAEELFQKILEIQRRTLGQEHPDTIQTLYLLALQYREEGKFAQSETLFAETLDLRRRELGTEHPDTLENMTMLAVVRRINGKYAQAEELLRQALEVGRSTLGEEHPNTILAMGELPGVYWVEGKYAEAEPLYLKVLEIRRRLLGEKNDDTVSTMNNLATLYMSEGKYAEAEPLLTTVLEVRRRVRGEDNPRTLISMNNLALLYRNQGRYTEAEATFVKVLERRCRALGEDSPDTLKTMDALAGVYRVEGKYAEAEPLLAKALEARRRVLGEQHPDTLLSWNGMALLYLDQGRHSQAEVLFQKVLDGRRQVLGRDHPDTISVLDSLGRMRLDQRLYREAEALLREALDGLEKKSPDTWQRYESQNMLGASLAGQGKYDEAEPLLLAGYHGLVRRESTISGPNRAALKQARERIVQLYQSWAKPEKAAEWREKVR